MPSQKRFWSILVSAGLASLLPCVPITPASAADDSEPTTIKKEMATVSAFIFNAQMKLRRGIVGVALESDDDSEVRTPARMCCNDNVKQIRKSLDRIRQLMRERGTCFEQKWDRGGTAAVEMGTQELRNLEAGIRAFADAMEIEDTHGALAGTQRAYLNLKRHLDVLPECSLEVPETGK